MGIGCQRNEHWLRPIICRVMACAAKELSSAAGRCVVRAVNILDNWLIGYKLILITNRKSHMSVQLVPKSLILNDLARRNDPYFALFHRIRRFGADYVKVVE